MEDYEIVEQYWQRDEQAIAHTAEKYNRYCYSISLRIVRSGEDAEECVNETWLRTWNSIPTSRPSVLPPFLAKIVRNLSIDRLRRIQADCRGGGEYPLVLDELRECSAPESVEETYRAKELGEAVNRFLHTLPKRECGIFLDRYFYLCSMAELAKKWDVSANHAGVILHRTRQKLTEALRKEGLL